MASILDRGHKLATVDLDELAVAIREADAWTPHRARTVDRELRSRVIDALRARAGSDDVSTLQDRLQRSVNLARGRLATVEGDWAARWSGILDVLSLRLEQLDRLDEGAVLRRAHVVSILDHVRSSGANGAKQADIAAAIGQSAQAVSRLLRVIEDHGLVERTAAGREKRVVITEAGRRSLGQSAQPADVAANASSAGPESLDGLPNFNFKAVVKEVAPNALRHHFRRDGTPVSRAGVPRIHATVALSETRGPDLPSHEGSQRAAVSPEGGLGEHHRDPPTGRAADQRCGTTRQTRSAEHERTRDEAKSVSKFLPAEPTPI